MPGSMSWKLPIMIEHGEDRAEDQLVPERGQLLLTRLFFDVECRAALCLGGKAEPGLFDHPPDVPQPELAGDVLDLNGSQRAFTTVLSTPSRAETISSSLVREASRSRTGIVIGFDNRLVARFLDA